MNVRSSPGRSGLLRWLIKRSLCSIHVQNIAVTEGIRNKACFKRLGWTQPLERSNFLSTVVASLKKKAFHPKMTDKVRWFLPDGRN